MIDAIARALGKSARVLGVAPTASGKSFIVAGVVQRYLARYPSHRVLVLTHTREILTQNEEKIRLLGTKDTGVYCAGLGRKETAARVVLASRDSLGANPTACGYFHMIIVDEAHLLSEDKESMYQRIFDAIQPQMAVGLTGTPWRLDNGLVYGKRRFWARLADSITMEEVRDAGFLCPYVLPPSLPVLIDTTNVKTTAGDFNNKQLTAVSMTDAVVSACVESWWLQAADRRTSLFFCCSRDHAEVVVRHIERYTKDVAYLDGLTSAKERNRILAKSREGAYKAIVNVAVLTTGTDIPIIDCVVFLRATQSVALFVQAAGRGLRIHPEKRDVLFLDYAGNFARFGSLEKPVTPRGKGKAKDESDAIAALLAQEGIELVKNEAPLKTCPACEAKTAAASTKCPECGHVFFNHDTWHLASDALEAAGIFPLKKMQMWESTTRKGAACTIIEYETQSGERHREWLFPNFPGFQKWQAVQKLDALKNGATHIRVVKKPAEKYPQLFPLNLRSKGSFSVTYLEEVSSSGVKTPSGFTIRV